MMPNFDQNDFMRWTERDTGDKLVLIAKAADRKAIRIATSVGYKLNMALSPNIITFGINPTQKEIECEWRRNIVKIVLQHERFPEKTLWGFAVTDGFYDTESFTDDAYDELDTEVRFIMEQTKKF